MSIFSNNSPEPHKPHMVYAGGDCDCRECSLNDRIEWGLGLIALTAFVLALCC